MMDTRPDTRREVAERFRALRHDALLTQRMMADAVGICRTSISEIESCRVRLWLGTWEKFHVMESLFRRGAIDPHKDWQDWIKFR
jgi:DNA-binding XRE family transcriptional regulator